MSYFIRFYDHIMREWTDPKTRDWIINKPVLLVPVIVIYWMFCIQLGPKFMKNRPPYKITKIIQIYNISQVLVNTAIAVAGFFSVLHYNWVCQPIDYSLDPREIRVTTIGWFYCATKLFDLLDTVFFVLRKKFKQVSSLHLYHHIVMGGPFIFATNFYATGHPVFPFGLNMIIHILMYFYYYLASLGPRYQKHLWWKRHLTELQIIQFMTAFIHSLVAWYVACGVPLFIIGYFLAQSLFFAYLFGKFYINAYLKDRPTAPGTGMMEFDFEDDPVPLTNGESKAIKMEKDGIKMEANAKKSS